MIKNIKQLILLIGTNPLPNFVVADYFLQNSTSIEKIWLVHSEANNLQAGTDKQAKNLEALIRKRWEKENKHKNLQFPLEKVSLSDACSDSIMQAELNSKIINKINTSDKVHLNYTGGTKAMAIHVYSYFNELQKRGCTTFSYLDANNFRLVQDKEGIIASDLRKEVQITFDELIELHGFQRRNKDQEINSDEAENAFNKFIDPHRDIRNEDSLFRLKVERYLHNKVNELKNDLSKVYYNWEIKNPDWNTHFQLDILFLHGYQLTGISCTTSDTKDFCKRHGFEILLRSRQIGGDEARAVLITRADRSITRKLQEELEVDTGSNRKNILVLGIEDFREDLQELYLKKIREFVYNQLNLEK